jgi:hypothetical protein
MITTTFGRSAALQTDATRLSAMSEIRKNMIVSLPVDASIPDDGRQYRLRRKAGQLFRVAAPHVAETAEHAMNVRIGGEVIHATAATDRRFS